MGYYTNYSLTILEGDEYMDITETATTVSGEKVEIVRESVYALDRIVNHLSTVFNPFESECKWYNHEKDMISASEQFPDYVLELSGEGEESGDIWKKYFKNGKMQICQAEIVFDEFDENKLN